MRGVVNKPGLRSVLLGGFALIPVAFLSLTDRLGLGGPLLFFFLLLALLGSMVEIPLFSMRSRKPDYTPGVARAIGDVYGVPVEDELTAGGARTYDTQVALNLGGLLALILGLYGALISPPLEFMVMLLIMLVVTYLVSQPLDGVGVVVPPYIGVVALAVSIVVAPDAVAPVLLSGGTIGILATVALRILSFGEDHGSAFISIGGTGNFQAIYMTILIAVLASYFPL